MTEATKKVPTRPGSQWATGKRRSGKAFETQSTRRPDRGQQWFRGALVRRASSQPKRKVK